MTTYPQSLLPKSAVNKKRWGQLYGASESLAIAEFCSSHPGLTVVVVPNTPELLQLEAELAFFKPDSTPMAIFGDWETLTYDRVSPHQEIIAQRIRTLAALPTLSNGLLLVSASAMLQRLPPKEFLGQHALMIKPGDTLSVSYTHLTLPTIYSV